MAAEAVADRLHRAAWHAGARRQHAQPALASSSLATAIDYTRHVDSDCMIKNIRDCCRFPTACVSERKGMMSARDLPAILSCRCVTERCVAVNDTPTFGPR
jgi:hypothetical protein